jgi:Helix-turn-helix domain
MQLDDDAWLLPQEAAEFLHTTVQTLANWREHGGGPEHTLVGRRIFYPLSKLRAFRPQPDGAAA